MTACARLTSFRRRLWGICSALPWRGCRRAGQAWRSGPAMSCHTLGRTAARSARSGTDHAVSRKRRLFRAGPADFAEGVDIYRRHRVRPGQELGHRTCEWGRGARTRLRGDGRGRRSNDRKHVSQRPPGRHAGQGLTQGILGPIPLLQALRRLSTATKT